MTTHLTRREFMGAAAAAVSIPVLPRVPAAEPIPVVPFPAPRRTRDAMDRDLLEVTIPKLRALYESRKYSATQVTRWYLDRIARYDRVYRAVLHVDAASALARAAAEDAAAKAGRNRFQRGPLWGVPVVIKANTSVKGWVTSAGWCGGEGGPESFPTWAVVG